MDKTEAQPDDLVWIRHSLKSRTKTESGMEAAYCIGRQWLEFAGAKARAGEEEQEHQKHWNQFVDTEHDPEHNYIFTVGVTSYQYMKDNARKITTGELPPIEHYQRYQPNNGE